MLLRAIYRKYLSFNMLYQRFEGIILNLHFLQHSFSIEGHNLRALKIFSILMKMNFILVLQLQWKQCNLFMLIP